MEPLVSGWSPCPKQWVNHLRRHLYQLDNKILREALVKDQHDGMIHAFVRCLFEATIYNGGPQGSYRLQMWLKKITYDRGVFYVGPTENPEMFVMKVGNLQREAETALGITNQLRFVIPTFCYLYSVFVCPPPVLDSGRVLSWAGSNDQPKMLHLIMENAGGVSAEKYFKRCSEKNFLTILFQVLNALALANEKTGFVHGALIRDNVFVQTTEERVSVPFRKGYIRGNLIAKITGLNHASITGEGQWEDVLHFVDGITNKHLDSVVAFIKSSPAVTYVDILAQLYNKYRPTFVWRYPGPTQMTVCDMVCLDMSLIAEAILDPTRNFQLLDDVHIALTHGEKDISSRKVEELFRRELAAVRHGTPPWYEYWSHMARRVLEKFGLSTKSLKL